MTATTEPTPTHAQLLGEIIMEWSKVSPLLEELFAQLASLDDPYVLRVLLERVRDAQLDEVCKALSGRLVPEEKQDVLDWLELVKRARARRNEYLHGVYLPHPREGDGEVHTHILGRARLDHQRGVAEPRLTKLTRSDLTEFRDSVLMIQHMFPPFLQAPSHLGV
ncbi:hypothetical protein [Agromyces sp. NPDC057865]|uniref:hypothetical protein n=1 Tax=Agromyces sp. NPDC057865 TaxID=3346267 RepID=UPI003672D3AB